MGEKIKEEEGEKFESFLEEDEVRNIHSSLNPKIFCGEKTHKDFMTTTTFCGLS